jgi:formiminotetrahydrofolate cyclodeaminase
MYIDRLLRNYLDDLASAQPTPGGGSAAALSGAIGAALASMVAQLTLGKAEYAAVHAEMEMLLQQSERLRARFVELMQADIDAYGQLSACFKLPRTTPEERAARTQAIQARLVGAANVPLEMAERAVELAQCCQRIAEIGNKNLLSDVATGAMLTAGAANGAAWMVRTNLNAMKDQQLVQSLYERLQTALDNTTLFSQRVAEIVGARA